MKEPVIEFDGYQIEDIRYKRIQSNKEDEALEFDIKTTVECGVNQDCTRGIVIIRLFVVDPDNMRELEIEVSGFFKLNSSVTSEKEAYQYLGSNGVAIVYPYIRSFTSILTTLDSDKALVVPTVNTQDFYKSLEK